MKSYLWAILLVICLSTRHAVAQPGGETCGSATLIPGVPFNGNGLMGNSDDCPNVVQDDLFYWFQVPQSGDYDVSMCGSSLNTALRIWSGGCCSGSSTSVESGCADDPMITVPFTAGEIIYFEIGYSSNEIFSQPYTFVLTGPPPPSCGGTLLLPTTELYFAPTHIGSTAMMQVQAMNTNANQPLCISEIRTNGSIWSAFATDDTIPPNGQTVINVSFSPAFVHDFLGTIEIVSSDSANSLDSILVEGSGCRSVIQPQAPQLSNANSPNAVYFRAPWMQSNPEQEYAVEYSTDNFATSLYLLFPRGDTTGAAWTTSGQWGKESSCLIEALEYDLAYQVRFHARDCTGQDIIGPSSPWTTGSPIVYADPDLVIHVDASGDIMLTWNPQLQDTNGINAGNDGWMILYSANLDSEFQILDFTTEGSYSIPSPTADLQFYAVEPHITGVYSGSRMFISWPPNGAVLAGNHDIILNDELHLAEWDSFRIESDSLGFPVVLGTNWKDSRTLTGERGAHLDFEGLGLGAHAIYATVVDELGNSYVDSVNITVVETPYATFTAEYDSAAQEFELTEMETVIPAGFASAGTLWLLSHVGERYGSSPVIPWFPEFDSLMIAKPIPQIEDGILWGQDYWFKDDEENAALQPTTEGPEITLTQVRCCCDDIELITAGAGLGPIMNCGARSGAWEVGFYFAVKVTVKYELAEMGGECSGGQDAKGTRVISDGSCKSNANACVITHDTTIYKTYDGVDYPFTDTMTDGFGNDGFGPIKKGLAEKKEGRNRGPRDDSGLNGKDKVKKVGKASGTFRWRDEAGDKGTLQTGQCVRVTGQNRFFARWDPPCNSEEPCCLMWGTSWDVTFCKKQNECGTTSPLPTHTPLTPPGGCPALAGD